MVVRAEGDGSSSDVQDPLRGPDTEGWDVARLDACPTLCCSAVKVGWATARETSQREGGWGEAAGLSTDACGAAAVTVDPPVYLAVEGGSHSGGLHACM